MTNNASMEETLRAEVECLRKLLAEKDKEIKYLHDVIDVRDKENERLSEMLAYERGINANK